MQTAYLGLFVTVKLISGTIRAQFLSSRLMSVDVDSSFKDIVFFLHPFKFLYLCTIFFLAENIRLEKNICLIVRKQPTNFFEMPYGDFNKKEKFLAGLNRILAAPDRKAEGAKVLSEFVDTWEQSKKANNTILKYKAVFCTALTKAGVERSDLPTLNRSFNDIRRKQCVVRIIEKHDNPVVIGDYAGFMVAICKALRVAIDTKQCPEVIYLLNYIVPFRSNDQNEAHLRANDTRCDASSHRVVYDATAPDGRKVASGIANFLPSKANKNSFNYVTVPICDPGFYPLVYEAMAFVHDPAITALKCTTCILDYKTEVPSGPPKGQEWGSPHRGIMKHMLIKHDLCAYVSDWGTYEPGTLLSSMGRAFCASSIEQGRFRFEAPLTNTKALEYALGHAKNSSQNSAYLCFCCNEPPKVLGTSLRKVTKDDPLSLDNGTMITDGVCLVFDSL
jgi:hypothetical protein